MSSADHTDIRADMLSGTHYVPARENRTVSELILNWLSEVAPDSSHKFV